jgi:tRNA nucleotidyltransferase (CCA-adding enzyme)
MFGSNTRGTILPRKVDSKSDVDYMVIFDNSGNKKPQAFLDRLKKFTEVKYSTSERSQSYPTIVLNLNHIKFELVPAYVYSSYSSGYYIPKKGYLGDEWIFTDPSDLNQKQQFSV